MPLSSALYSSKVIQAPAAATKKIIPNKIYLIALIIIPNNKLMQLKSIRALAKFK